MTQNNTQKESTIEKIISTRQYDKINDVDLRQQLLHMDSIIARYQKQCEIRQKLKKPLMGQMFLLVAYIFLFCFDYFMISMGNEISTGMFSNSLGIGCDVGEFCLAIIFMLSCFSFFRHNPDYRIERTKDRAVFTGCIGAYFVAFSMFVYMSVINNFGTNGFIQNLNLAHVCFITLTTMCFQAYVQNAAENKVAEVI